MTTIAYIANEFPSPVESYVMDEITELRRRGIRVICCSGKRVAPNQLNPVERSFWKETLYFQPLTDDELMRSLRRLASNRHHLWQVLRPLILEPDASATLRIRALGHTLMGAALAEQLAPLEVQHIHAHHGYFASWMALTAAQLLGIGFSFTLHGSDLLRRADLLSAKLRACQFCVTISDFNRRHILRNYPSMPPEKIAGKIIVQRLGVDCMLSSPIVSTDEPNGRRFCILSVGRLHPIKDHRFLVQACSSLRNQGLNFICWIVGEGPERTALERQIRTLGLQEHVYLIGHLPRADLPGYYRYADLVVMTSQSEGIPVVLMEAMAHGKMVLAPAITGIPELVEHGRNGFLYEPGDSPDFVSAVRWIQANHTSLAEIQHAAAATIAASYNREQNLRAFAQQFIARLQPSDDHYAHPILQQVRLSV
jgi:colanic acid/amylovoran biosynthesis glycosyltransferase